MLPYSMLRNLPYVMLLTEGRHLGRHVGGQIVPNQDFYFVPGQLTVDVHKEHLESKCTVS